MHLLMQCGRSRCPDSFIKNLLINIWRNKMGKILVSKISEIADPMERPETIECLTSDRQEKIKILRNADDRKRCYLAGILLQNMCRELGIREPVFEIGDRGKPYIKGRSQTPYNVSHSGEYVVLAFMDEAEAEVGIDIQKKKPLHEKMVDKILSEKEMGHADDLIRVWSAKEAFIKWDGRGLSIPLSELEWKEDGSVSYEKENKTAHVQEIKIEEGYICCVCTDVADIKWDIFYIEG